MGESRADLHLVKRRIERTEKHGAREMLGYEALSSVVKAGSRLAIWLSTRI